MAEDFLTAAVMHDEPLRSQTSPNSFVLTFYGSTKLVLGRLPILNRHACREVDLKENEQQIFEKNFSCPKKIELFFH